MTTLLFTAAIVGTIHTLLGPDHYVPFVAISKAKRWTPGKTLLITILCGIGHVLGSIALGALGIALGWAIEPMNAVEGTRGSVAGWLLIGFGVAYIVWGLRRKWRPHGHTHVKVGAAASKFDKKNDSPLTPWVLFAIFVLGPCEPLIPLLMFPAASHSLYGIALVAIVFSICTIATMSAVVLLMLRGLAWVNPPWLERNSQVLAGVAICACGLAVQIGL